MNDFTLTILNLSNKQLIVVKSHWKVSLSILIIVKTLPLKRNLIGQNNYSKCFKFL